MRSLLSSAASTRSTAALMFGSRNGSLNDLRRGRRKVCTSSAVAKPLRKSSRAMQAQSQISFHEIAPPLSSSGGAMIQRVCTDYVIRALEADKIDNHIGGLPGDLRSEERRVGKE